MMKQILTIIILTLQLVAYGQDRYFILPYKQDIFLFKKNDKKLIDLQKTNIPISNLFCISNDTVITINQDTTQLIIYTVISDSLSLNYVESIPNSFKLVTIKKFNNYLLLGGNWNSSGNFYSFDLNKKIWTKTQLPIEIFFPGKAIDDFLILNSKLILVDNIVMPKYLIEYELNEIPNFSKYRIFELESNGTYEHIRKGIINKKFIVLLSGTAGGYPNSNSDHITVLRVDNFNNGFSISSKKIKNWSYLNWTDIALINNTVYVSCYKKGLGKLRIYPSYFWNRFSLWDNCWKNRNLGKWRIRHCWFSPKNITKIMKFDEKRLILLYNDKNGDYKFKIK